MRRRQGGRGAPEVHAVEVPGGGMGEEAGIIILVLDFI
jgi:hypothetical protein